MKKVLLFCIIITVTTHAFSQFKNPADPIEPKMDEVILKGENLSYQVTLNFANGKTQNCKLLFPVDKISVKLSNKQNKSFLISEINSIECVNWQGEKKSKDTFLFKPNKVIINLKNKSVIETIGIYKDFLTINAENPEGKKMKYYMFYYDYWRNNVWDNSKQNDRSYPESHPNPQTVVKISFI